MVADTSGIAHSRCGNNNLRRRIKVNIYRFVAGNRKLQTRKRNGVNALPYKLSCLIVIAFQLIFFKYMCCLYGQGAVYIYLKPVMSMDQPLTFYMTEIIQKLLSTPHSKCRNYHIAAPIQGFLDNPNQLSNMILSLLMKPIAIG